MKRLITLLIISLLGALGTIVLGQRYSEFGLLGGVSFYNGDINPTKMFPSKDTHFAGGVFFRRNWNPRWAIRYQMAYAKISGNDAYSKDPFQVNRNLSFTNSIWEFSSVVEFNFLHFTPFKPSSYFQVSDVVSPYLYIGLSLFYHNPKTALSGNEYTLRSIQTENVSYKVVSLAIPFGLGLKFRLSDRIILGVEWSMRRTFTDYLDDVSTVYPDNPQDMSKVARDLSDRSLSSQGDDGTNWGTQRGNSYTKDWFSMVGLALSYNITRNPNNCHFNRTK